MPMHHTLAPRPHGVIDYALVALLVMAPSWLAFGGFAATLAYVLAAIHLTLSLITAYPLGVLKLVPFPAHGQLELLIGSLLVIAPWFLPFAGDAKARGFFIVVGVVVLAVYALTNYLAAEEPESINRPRAV